MRKRWVVYFNIVIIFILAGLVYDVYISHKLFEKIGRFVVAPTEQTEGIVERVEKIEKIDKLQSVIVTEKPDWRLCITVVEMEELTDSITQPYKLKIDELTNLYERKLSNLEHVYNQFKDMSVRYNYAQRFNGMLKIGLEDVIRLSNNKVARNAINNYSKGVRDGVMTAGKLASKTLNAVTVAEKSIIYPK